MVFQSEHNFYANINKKISCILCLIQKKTIRVMMNMYTKEVMNKAKILHSEYCIQLLEKTFKKISVVPGDNHVINIQQKVNNI